MQFFSHKGQYGNIGTTFKLPGPNRVQAEKFPIGPYPCNNKNAKAVK